MSGVVEVAAAGAVVVDVVVADVAVAGAVVVVDAEVVDVHHCQCSSHQAHHYPFHSSNV